ncbi:MAG TPA: hypothetical protein VJ672_00120 [Gemmatimonadaceae bacterium]|nr:hypothetical protein [Gemmatimonadaceae bacterium]
MALRLLKLSLALMVLVVNGCFLFGGKRTADANEPVVLTVENHHWNDVTISYVKDGVANRLGVATAASTAYFQIPSHALTSQGIISFMADPVGASSVLRSESVSVKAGQGVLWNLERDLRRSVISVH